MTLRSLLWKAELNPRVRCAFGNVFRYVEILGMPLKGRKSVECSAKQNYWYYYFWPYSIATSTILHTTANMYKASFLKKKTIFEK